MAKRGIFLLAVLLLASSTPAFASDFWDEVRTPGLRSYTRLVNDARRSLNTGQNEAALSLSDEAIRLLAQRSEALVTRARALAALNRDTDAYQVFRAVLERDPNSLDDTQDASVAARTAAEAHDYTLAISILRHTVDREAPGATRASLYIFLGDMIQCEGEAHIRDAVSAYRAGIRGTASDPRARLGLALALRRIGERADAVAALGSLLALGGRIGNSLAPLRAILPETEIASREAVALEAMHDVSGARDAWTRASAEGPWSSFAQRELTAVASNAAATTAPTPRPFDHAPRVRVRP